MIAARNAEVQRNFNQKLKPVVPPPTPTPPVIALPKSKRDELNKTELRYLALLGTRGYQDIRIHAIRFRIAGKCYYTPEFYCFHEGRQYVWEVKGNFEYEDAIIKLKATAALWPAFIFVIARWKPKEGGWFEKTINL